MYMINYQFIIAFIDKSITVKIITVMWVILRSWFVMVGCEQIPSRKIINIKLLKYIIYIHIRCVLSFFQLEKSSKGEAKSADPSASTPNKDQALIYIYIYIHV